MTPDINDLYEVSDQTWPAARRWAQDGWTLREGQGGGKRVSAATALTLGETGDIDAAEKAMRALGQRPLFLLRDGEEALDDTLAARGYTVLDPVTIYVAPITLLTDLVIPRVTAFTVWEPLAIMLEIWASGGIGPARIEAMSRAKVKTGILARWNDQPGGAAFAAVHNGVCMVHALEVLEHQRKQGLAQWMMRRAAFWGQEQGATHLSVLSTKASAGANALYQSLGFDVAGSYHYRQSPDT